MEDLDIEQLREQLRKEQRLRKAAESRALDEQQQPEEEQRRREEAEERALTSATVAPGLSIYYILTVSRPSCPGCPQ